MTDCKYRFAAGLFALALLLSSLRLLFPVQVSAAELTPEAYAAEILVRRTGGTDLQTWVNTTLAGAVGDSEPDWYVMSFARRGCCDLSYYGALVHNYLTAYTVPSATSRERLALSMIACGYNDPQLCTEVLDSSAEQLGVMSRIFALHLVNNGVTSQKYNASSLIPMIQQFQSPDGGFSIFGTAGDPDVTAMAIQALAPYQFGEAAAAVQNGLNYLSAVQLASGAYQSFGTENPESTAQVWMALQSLGIDPLTDPRFIKNGHTLLDGIVQFRTEPGAYSHTLGGPENAMANVQVYQALTSETLLYSGLGAFYLFRGPVPPLVPQTEPETTTTALTDAQKTTAKTSKATENTTATERTTGSKKTDKMTSRLTTKSTKVTEIQGIETTNLEESETETRTISSAGETDNVNEKNVENAGIISTKKYPYRIPLTVAAGMIFAGVAVFFVIRKQKSPKTYLTLAAGFAAVTGLIWFIKIETPAQFYTVDGHSGGGTVTMAISCAVICGMPGSEAYPEDGVIMPETAFTIEPDESALTLLYDAVKQEQLQIEVDGVSGDIVETAYVRGIASLYEFDFGDLSGWTYTVNGERPSVGCGAYTLHDGDVVVWEYTVSL